MEREVLFNKSNSIVNAEFTEVLHIINTGNTAQVERMMNGQCYVRRFAPKARLILLGGGHIAVFLCKIASLYGFFSYSGG